MVERLLGEQFKAKEKLIAANVQALRLGYEHARVELAGRCGLKVRRADRVGDRIFLDGNDAAGLGCVYGGATVAAWYPITPSTSVAEAFARHCRALPHRLATGKSRYAIVQAEDELAAIGMVIGAAWNGARAFTATSGPGISLMQEFIGLAYFAEIPAVIIDVQRGGPSTGMPTRTQQSDILVCAYASHGDTKQVLLFPSDPKECFEMAADALDLADRLQTPVFVLQDLDIGMNEWLCEPLPGTTGAALRPRQGGDRRAARGRARVRPLSRRRRRRHRLPHLARHPPDQGRLLHPRHLARPLRALQRGGCRSMSTTCSGCCASSRPRSRWCRRRSCATPREPTRFGLIYFGSSAAAVDEAMVALERRGIHLDTLRLRAFPFADEVADFVNDHDQVFIVEQNRDAQMRTLLVNECGVDPARFIPVLHFDGTPITARFITGEVAARLTRAQRRAREEAMR